MYECCDQSTSSRQGISLGLCKPLIFCGCVQLQVYLKQLVSDTQDLFIFKGYLKIPSRINISPVKQCKYPGASLENPSEKQDPRGLNPSCSCSTHVWVVRGLQNQPLSGLKSCIGAAQGECGWKPTPKLQVLAWICDLLWFNQCNLIRLGSVFIQESSSRTGINILTQKALTQSWRFRCLNQHPRPAPPGRSTKDFFWRFSPLSSPN